MNKARHGKLEEITTDLEGALRRAADSAIKSAIQEMEGQRLTGAGGRPFSIVTDITAWNGQSFRVTIECAPPPAAVNAHLN